MVFSPDLSLRVGAKINDKLRTRYITAISTHLRHGERLLLLIRTNKLNPVVNVIAVTSARVIAMHLANASAGPKISVSADDITRVEVRPGKLTSTTVSVFTAAEKEVGLGPMVADSSDAKLLQSYLEGLPWAGIPDEVIVPAAEANAKVDEAWYENVVVIGSRPSRKAIRTVVQHSRAGEKPWLVLGAGLGAGILAAFEDRLFLVKTGALTGFMTGAMGGGRMTTFPYTEITGLEYNAGMMNGVLEILTPSYQGTTNKDFWRGTLQGRNADSNDPFTLSNTLPFPKYLYKQALPHLTTLREKISLAKRPNFTITPAPAEYASGGLAEELARLSQLREQGVLTEEEFTAAKLAAIQRH